MSLAIGLLNGLSIGLTYAENDGHHVVLTCLVFSSQSHLETPAPVVDSDFHCDVGSIKGIGQRQGGSWARWVYEGVGCFRDW